MLVLISGPSGAGKSTFVRTLLDAESGLSFSISTTTRPPRQGEQDGVQYQFVDDATFDKLVAEDAFVEWANVHDHRYGTRRDHLQKMMDHGLIPLLDLDVQGGVRVIELFGQDVCSVFLFPPSWDVLTQRLRGRGTEDEAAMKLRLDNARWEIGFADRYDYFIVNDELETAMDQMLAIITAEQCRRERIGQPPLTSDE
ncbi:MAG: guanylate kinase [bacterium]